MINQRDYEVYIRNDKLLPGDTLSLEHKIYYKEASGDLSPYIQLSLGELCRQKEESAAKEQKLFNELEEVFQRWDEQAAQTQRINKAIEYMRTPSVKHTANKWVTNEYGQQEISNMVYRMYFRPNEDTKYNRKKGKMETVGWSITWYVILNVSHSNEGVTIAGQRNKFFTDANAAQQYVQGRFKAYSHLFQQLSPPIPKEYSKYFMVNGHLLPGYAIEKEEPSKPAPSNKKPARVR